MEGRISAQIFLVCCLVLLTHETLGRSHFRTHMHPDYKDHHIHTQDTKSEHAPPATDDKQKASGDSTKLTDKQAEASFNPDVERIRREDKQEASFHPSFAGAKVQQSTTGVDWVQRGQDELAKALNTYPTWAKAKNVIYFIGDGLGISTLTAARIYKAQRQGKPVTDGHFSWEDFPYTGLAKTYNTDQQTPDSAGTATAFICGEKARDGVICVNENVVEGDCAAVAGNELRSLLHTAMDAGKWGGIATTTRVTHATPACAFAVSPDRGWEADSDVPLLDRDTCWDIARQLVERNDSRRLRVVLGGGRRNFIPDTMFDNEYPTSNGDREDGRDLRAEWLAYKQADGLLDSEYQYVENKTDFDNVDASSIQYLFGLFEPSHMKFETDRMEETGDTWTEPSLSDMVKKSLDILKRSPDGYFLYVEGGRIDHAHHSNNADRALRDVMAMDEAVQLAINETNANDTLIMVTADHSHVFTMAGYPNLNNDILATVVNKNNNTSLATDNKPYLTVQYANGPGYIVHRTYEGTLFNETTRKDLTGEDTIGKEFVQDAAVPLSSETHGGEDVAIFARGPMAHLFSGTHEQHYIAHAAGYASCLGWNTDFCDSNPPPPWEV